MKTRHFIISMLFSLFIQPVFSHPFFQWLITDGLKPKQSIYLSGNRKNGQAIIMYSIFDKKKIDYCYMGGVKNGLPNGEGAEYFKFSTVGFNKDSIKKGNFGANGYFLEIKGTYTDGKVCGNIEVVFNSSGNSNNSQKIALDKAIGVFGQINEDNQVLEIYFSEILGVKNYYKGKGISKDEIYRVAEQFARSGVSTISLNGNLEGVFKRGSTEQFDGVCDKNLLQMEGIKTYQSGTEQITCYIKNYDAFPVRIVSSYGARFFALTDAEEKELKRISITSDTISDKNLFISLENARNTILKQDFMDSRTLTANYKVYEHSSEFDVLLKFSEGKISMKVVSNKKLINPIIAWKRNLIVPLDSKFKTQFEDGYYFWWDSVHHSGNSLTNEHSWKLYDSIHLPFPIGYFGMKFEVVFTNSKYNVELPFVLISETGRNEIKRLGSEANKAYQLAKKDKEAKEKMLQEQKLIAEQKKKDELKKQQEEKEKVNQAYWKNLGGYHPINQSNSSEFEHFIGESFGGGLIFHLWKDDKGVEHGLVVSRWEEEFCIWSNVSKTAVGNIARSEFDGMGNSKAIVKQLGHKNSAALYCLNYSYNPFGSTENYTDWYLPAIGELKLLMEVGIAKLNHSLDNKMYSDNDIRYLSSTEISNTDYYEAYYYDKSTSYTVNGGVKWNVCADYNKRRVRPIRRF